MSKFCQVKTAIKVEDKDYLVEAIKRVWSQLWGISLTDKDIEFHDPWVEERVTPEGKISVPHVGRPLYGYQGDKREEEANVIVRRKNMPAAYNDWGMVDQDGSGFYTAHEQKHQSEVVAKAVSMIKGVVSALKLEDYWKEVKEANPGLTISIDDKIITDLNDISKAVQNGILNGQQPKIKAKAPPGNKPKITGFEGGGGGFPGSGGGSSKPKPIKKKETE